MLPNVRLFQVTRDDVSRISEWLRDEEVNSFWYGTDDQDQPLHIGYVPRQMLEANGSEWDRVFRSEERKILSVLSEEGEHIGEGQIVIEAPLYEAQLFVLIGRKDLWYWGFGTAAMVHLLDLAFYTYDLHRAWVNIPEYNLPALHMCERVGFILEGRLRATHPNGGQWYDSLVMGLLSDEYERRRPLLIEQLEEAAV